MYARDNLCPANVGSCVCAYKRQAPATRVASTVQANTADRVPPTLRVPPTDSAVGHSPLHGTLLHTQRFATQATPRSALLRDARAPRLSTILMAQRSATFYTRPRSTCHGAPHAATLRDPPSSTTRYGLCLLIHAPRSSRSLLRQSLRTARLYAAPRPTPRITPRYALDPPRAMLLHRMRHAAVSTTA
jgi:hypothetical protein